MNYARTQSARGVDFQPGQDLLKICQDSLVTKNLLKVTLTCFTCYIAFFNVFSEIPSDSSIELRIDTRACAGSPNEVSKHASTYFKYVILLIYKIKEVLKLEVKLNYY